MNRLLIVDDETSMLRGIEFHLQDHGKYEISTASDAETALKLLQSNEFDLVVSDLMMPDISDGLTVIKTASEQWYQPGILAMTAYESVENAVNAMKAGANDFISKGFGLDEMSLRIENMLKKKRQIDQLAIENRILKETIQKQFSDFRIIGNSPQILELIKKLEKVAADAKTTCLIQGESGTGKDLIARAIHQMSSRRQAPFVPINCAAIPENLIESELFGHERGAFTGAYETKQGKFEHARGGIIFLDEIGELPHYLQVKLLRVLEERKFYRVGGKHAIEVEVMIISATNSDLASQVKKGEFREDLYFRLNVINLVIPPLRERPQDIRPLAQFFLDDFNRQRNKKLQFSEDAMRILESYDFPGNVRELRNIVEDAFVFCEGKRIYPEDLSFRKLKQAESNDTLDERTQTNPVLEENGSLLPYKKSLDNFEKIYFTRLMEENFWSIKNASEYSKLSRKWISTKLKRLGLKSLTRWE